MDNNGLVAKKKGYGVVKAVNSGDSITVIGAAAPGQWQHPEKNMYISGLLAPKLAKNKMTSDEPWAWECREYLRKLLIGRQVAFTINHSTSDGDRDYVDVQLDGVDVATLLVRNGYGIVKESNGGRLSPDRQALADLEEEAKRNGAGIWAKGADAEAHRRSIEWGLDRKIFDQLKGNAVPCVVSQVRDGTNMRVELFNKATNKHHIVNVNLSGVASPRTALPFNYLMKQYKDQKAADPEGDHTAPSKENNAPFADEAVSFVENRVLYRSMMLTLHTMDKFGNLWGSLLHPKGNVAMRLLETGLARYVDWTARPLDYRDQLAALNNAAAAEKLRLHSLQQQGGDSADLQAAAIASGEIPSKKFDARVTYVQSGDLVEVEVLDDKADASADKSKIRVALASIRCPRVGSRGKADEPWAFEAKEFVRSRCFNKKVKIQVEYSRAAAGSNTPRHYVSLLIHNMNISEGLLLNGIAETMKHRAEEERSSLFARLLEAEASAAAKKVGMHSNSKGVKIIDLTERKGNSKADGDKDKDDAPEAGKTAGAYLPQLKRTKQFNGVVDRLFHSTKLKVYVPKENIYIAFSLAGVRCPQLKKSDGSIDPIGQEANDAIRSLCLQNSVTMEAETVDRSNAVVGSMWVNKVNLAVSLLERGLAQCNGYSAERSPYAAELFEAESNAKARKIKIWENYVPEVKPVEDADTDLASPTGNKSREMTIRLTDITDACTFYAHNLKDNRYAKVEELMAAYEEKRSEGFEIERGAILAGRYGDGSWHRVRVEGRATDDEWKVNFIDFGNHEAIYDDALAELSSEIQSIPPCALPCVLAGLKAPATKSEWYEEAANAFHNTAWDKTLTAKIETKAKDGKYHLSLFEQVSESSEAAGEEGGEKAEEKESEVERVSINHQLVKAGYCRVVERAERGLYDLVKALRDDENEAKSLRYNIWEYGDVSDDEDEDDGKRRRDDGRVPKRKV